MSVVINIYYTGTDGNARKFADEMISSGLVDSIRAEKGNEGYEYYFPQNDSETVLLIDKWSDQKALDMHHNSPIMKKIIELRDKYNLKMHIEQYVTNSPNRKYKVITLCGSTKFKDQFMEIQKKLTLEGNIVISVGVFGHFENLDMAPETKIMLDDIHKRKIDMADEIFVINKDGYIGQSTKSEIEYAKKTGKKINYLEQI